MLDRQILFGPLEEQLDLPSPFVDSGDSERSKIGMIGKEYQMQTGFRVAERNTALPLRIWLMQIISFKAGRLLV